MLQSCKREYPNLDRFDECRTGKINAEVSWCLSEEKSHGCTYSMLLGEGYLCTHPYHRKFR